MKYTNRSRNFELLWNPNTTIIGGEDITGFMQPRFADGRFTYTDPRHCTVHDPRHSTCYLSGANHDGFYEGGPIVVSATIPLSQLISFDLMFFDVLVFSGASIKEVYDDRPLIHLCSMFPMTLLDL